MNWYDHYAILVNFLGRDRKTRSSVERIQNGYFKNKLDYYVQYRIIAISRQNDSRDDLIYLTDIGLKLWWQETTMERVLKMEEE